MRTGILKSFTGLATAAAIAFGLACTSSAFAAGSITIKGSDTMAPLGQAWSEAFMEKHSGIDISVQGGGSGTGVAALINGTTDVCQASRAMSASEIAKCRDRNVTPVATVVALDGISIAVNSSNPIDSITIDQLKGIYTGKIRNWKQLGGKNSQIVFASRESSSGTYVYFKERVLNNQNYAPDALLMPSTKAIQMEVQSNGNAIGYGGVAYFKHKKGIKIIPVSKSKGSPAIEPTDENVRSKKYPIARPLFVYTAGKPKGAVGTYIKFCLSTEGQRLVEQVGYVSIR